MEHTLEDGGEEALVATLQKCMENGEEGPELLGYSAFKPHMLKCPKCEDWVFDCLSHKCKVEKVNEVRLRRSRKGSCPVNERRSDRVEEEELKSLRKAWQDWEESPRRKAMIAKFLKIDTVVRRPESSRDMTSSAGKGTRWPGLTVAARRDKHGEEEEVFFFFRRGGGERRGRWSRKPTTKPFRRPELRRFTLGLLYGG